MKKKLYTVCNSAWTRSLYIKFEFCRVSELYVWTQGDYKCLPIFEFKLKFEDEFSKFWPKYFEYFKFYRVLVCLNTNHQARVWLSLKLECLNLSKFRVAGSSIVCKVFVSLLFTADFTTHFSKMEKNKKCKMVHLKWR